jgi:cold-inducible RNA-binding protein
MENKLYVGNLSYNAKEEDLRNLFSKFGNIQNVSIIIDRFSGQSKGFAFVQMASGDEAQKALELNGSEFLGRNLTVAEARPQEKRSAGGNNNKRGNGFSGGRREFGQRAARTH